MTGAGWIEAGLDVALILLLGIGIVQGLRLLRQLAGLRQGRADMERFVREFGSIVGRAEAGIKGLKQAARDSGDDLEKLIEKGSMLRDELQFLTESADQIANRLGEAAAAARTAEKPAPEKRAANKPAPAAGSAADEHAAKKPGAKSSSRAEEELMQALEKLG